MTIAVDLGRKATRQTKSSGLYVSPVGRFEIGLHYLVYMSVL